MLNSAKYLGLFLILTSTAVSTLAGVINNGGNVIKTVTGRLYLLKPETGHQHRLTRRHFESDASSSKPVRLVLESDDNDIDMTLFRESVWTEDSKTFERHGEDVVEVPLDLDSSCFLTGELSSGEGSASFYSCDGFSGFIQTPGMEYLVEQSLSSGDVTDDIIAEVTVTMVTPEKIPVLEDFNDVYTNDDEHDLETEEDEERSFFENDNSTVRTKRRSSRVKDAELTAEISVYADKIYADYLKSAGKGTLKKATAFFVNKWNTIARVYGNKAKVGLKFHIQLKHVEIWWKNPRFYVGVQSSEKLGDHLDKFCANTHQKDKADHRMLYTVGYGGGVMGLASTGAICTRSGCSVVKSKGSSVRVEIHEFGHSLGFRHEPDMLPCSKPWGFMGWDWDTYKFNDCYKRFLLQVNRKKPKSWCLRHVNMKGKKVLN